MVWVVEKKIFHHILDMGFESVAIPVRVKFEFAVKEGIFVPDSLSVEFLYNQQAVARHYPGVKKDSLEKEIQKTIQREIRSYLQNCGFISENMKKKTLATDPHRLTRAICSADLAEQIPVIRRAEEKPDFGRPKEDSHYIMNDAPNLTPASQHIPRLPAIDAMRGIVMVLMALDHASHAFNAGRYVTDATIWYRPGSEIPAAQFLTQWVTHLCAPTFLFLAGFALALSVAQRQARGDQERSIDRDIFIRGVFILLLDPLWMSFGFGEGIVLQVLYAIGVSLCCMVPLRRFGARDLFAVCLGSLLCGEALAKLAVWTGGGQQPGPIGALLITGLRSVSGVFVLYPLLPWLAYMILGCVFGRRMLRNDAFKPVQFFSLAGVVSLSLFLIIRGFNQYGNMLLYRYDNSFLQWLHVSKYPPSLSFAAIELGLMFLMLAFLFACYRNRKASSVNPLLVFGRTPLFFYVIHVHLLAASAGLLNLYQAGGLIETYIATLAALLVLYPLCLWYGRVKQSHPGSLLHYL